MKKKNELEDKNKNIEENEPSVFGGNTDVKVTRDYSLGKLLKSRRNYYILCLSLVSISAICLGVTYGLRDKRSFDDTLYEGFKVTNLSSQFNMSGDIPDADGNIENDYYLYYYSTTCSVCETISSVIFNYIDSMATHDDPTVLYFLEMNSLYDTSNFSSASESTRYSTDEYKDHLIGANSTQNLIDVFTNITYTPTLFRIRDAKVKDVYVGSDEIVNELDLRDYNQYETISLASEQLQQSLANYYIYYFDSSYTAKDFKKTILDYADKDDRPDLYFANAETLELIQENFDISSIIGTTDSNTIKIPYAPYMLKIENRIVTQSYSTISAIESELGIISNE